MTFLANFFQCFVQLSIQTGPLLITILVVLTRLPCINITVSIIIIVMSALGIMGKSSDSLITMLDDLRFDKIASNIIMKKLMNIAIRCTYYVFCCRNKSWANPEPLDF